jgi:hypothetical protein
VQTVTLTQGLLRYKLAEQSEPLTVMGMTLAGGPLVTLRVVDTEMPPTAAVIGVSPSATEVARPFVPAALLMVATEVTDDVQLAAVVRTCVLLSE